MCRLQSKKKRGRIETVNLLPIIAPLLKSLSALHLELHFFYLGLQIEMLQFLGVIKRETWKTEKGNL